VLIIGRTHTVGQHTLINTSDQIFSVSVLDINLVQSTPTASSLILSESASNPSRLRVRRANVVSDPTVKQSQPTIDVRGEIASRRSIGRLAIEKGVHTYALALKDEFSRAARLFIPVRLQACWASCRQLRGPSAGVKASYTDTYRDIEDP
jgi:hypothetical protein